MVTIAGKASATIVVGTYNRAPEDMVIGIVEVADHRHILTHDGKGGNWVGGDEDGFGRRPFFACLSIRWYNEGVTCR